MKSNSRWADRDVERLVVAYPYRENADLAKTLGRTKTAVTVKWSNLRRNDPVKFQAAMMAALGTTRRPGRISAAVASRSTDADSCCPSCQESTNLLFFLCEDGLVRRYCMADECPAPLTVMGRPKRAIKVRRGTKPVASRTRKPRELVEAKPTAEAATPARKADWYAGVTGTLASSLERAAWLSAGAAAAIFILSYIG